MFTSEQLFKTYAIKCIEIHKDVLAFHAIPNAISVNTKKKYEQYRILAAFWKDLHLRMNPGKGV